VICFLPQAWLWRLVAWTNKEQGFGPIQEVVRRMQG
jgi:hypothetical protein